MFLVMLAAICANAVAKTDKTKVSQDVSPHDNVSTTNMSALQSLGSNTYPRVGNQLCYTSGYSGDRHGYKSHNSSTLNFHGVSTCK